MMRSAAKPLCLGLLALGLLGPAPADAAADVLFDAAASAGIVIDDNAPLLKKTIAEQPTVEGSLASFDGGFQFVWSHGDDSEVASGAILGLDLRVATEDTGQLPELNPLTYGFAVNGSADTRVDDSKRVKKLTFAFEVDWQEIERGGATTTSALTLTPAVQLTFKGNSGCDLDNLLLYGQRSDVDDEFSTSDPVYDRTGDTDVFGIEYIQYGSGGAEQCERWNPFRQFVPLHTWSYSIGFRHEDLETDGTEFDLDSTSLYINAYLPILDRESPRWGVTLRGLYDRVSYDQDSVVFPGARGDDDKFYRLAGTVRRGFLNGACGEDCNAARLKQFGMEFGLAYERLSSDIPLFDYSRAIFTAAFNVRWSNNNPDSSAGNIGAETRRRVDHVGSSRPTSPSIQAFVP